MHVPRSIAPKGLSGAAAGLTAGISGLLRAAMARLPFAQYEGYVGAYAEHYRDEYALSRGERAAPRTRARTCSAS